ncbi:MAG: ammonium transporter [Candidatus Methanoperedens sp.]|nr:ammonium transporter [Candidatus Methanoperedens sp.]MCE8429498.1 ammonium transporter [Candidatus Methanoperedens sp.]
MKKQLLIIYLIVMLVSLISPASADNTLSNNDIARSINFTWLLIAAFLVFFMQVGFAMLGAGIIRVKNSLNFFTMVFMDFSLGALAFWSIGFALMFGGSNASIGLDLGNAYVGYSGFLLAGKTFDNYSAGFMLFQVMFAAATVSIVACAVVERLKFKAYLLYTVAVTAIIYPIYGHWIWGGGWLSQLGVKDFAGSGAVHAVGGFVALAGAYLLGPRIGKFDKDGKPNVIPGHDITYIVIGTFILIFGWFGFNAGSTLSATDLRISVIALNTFMAAAAGATSVCFLMVSRSGKADITMICNGALGGLVAITGPCAYVAPWAAVLIGMVGGIIFVKAYSFVEWKLKIDDPVGAIACHAANGIWGLLAVGIFADGSYQGVTGLIAGNTDQIYIQLIGAITAIVWAFGMGYIVFSLIDRITGLRVSPEEELQGLDICEHGICAYPEFSVNSKDTR